MLCHHRPAGILFDRNRGCMDAGAFKSTCCPTRPRRGSRTHRLRGNRHELHHRLERYLPHRGPRIPLHRAEVLADHHDPWLSYRRNRAIGPKIENWSRRLRGKAQVPPGLPFEQSSKSFCRLTAAARNERSAVERKIPLPPKRGAKPDQERNKINGRGPPPAGRMPFMSDSTLIRLSAVLRRLNPPN